MAQSVNFQYKYPYSAFNTNSRYYAETSAGQISLNGFDVHTIDFKKTTPYIISVSITIGCCPTSGANASGRSWRFYYYYSGGWGYSTFTMPSCSMNEWVYYTWTGSIGASVTRFTACPASSSYSHTWTSNYTFELLRVREALTTVDLSSTDYISGLFTNQYGVQQKPSAVSVNIGGVITKAAKVLVNVDGTLKELPPAYNGAYTTTTPDTMRVYEFTPPTAGDYKIEVVRNSGDHEARMYNSAFTQMHPNESSGNSEGSYFYNGTFTLTGGSLYYISLIHHVSNIGTSDSVLFITRV